MNNALNEIKEIDKIIEKEHLYNEYEVIDWQDTINELSVKFVD